EAWEPSYYVSGVWNLSLPSVRVIDNAYVYSAPRGEVLGPYAVVRVSWVKASLSEVASGKVSLHPLLRELALDFEKSLAGPGRLDISFRVAQAYYDLASGIALAYGALVDPAVYIAKGGLEDSLSPYSINALIGGMGDYHQANETIRSILRDLADGQGYVVDSAYVYLYDASMRQLEFKVARKTGVNRLDMMLSDMALSRSKILGGGVEWNGTQFIGGWNWTLVNSLLGGGSAAVPEAGPNTTGADEVATAPGGSPWLLALTVAGILLGSLLLLARARGRR
ncbi:MAG: hypothetical protein LRS43_00360, partial [Desulfurococcales archaeon]|nr:hypothetical protein [Desulfurococcales archaeon]